MKGNHPEQGMTVFRPVEDELPEAWEPLIVVESFQQGGLKIKVQDRNGDRFVLAAGEWVDMNLSSELWATMIPFVIESSRGRSLYLLEGGNTMVYIPKCKLAVETGLPDASVMRAISGENSIRYTKCPYDAESGKECQYPKCTRNLVSQPQPSIKAAKAEFRDAVCVALTRNVRGNKMMFLTNGANHLNLITVEQAVETAWNANWLKELEPAVSGVFEHSWDSLDEPAIQEYYQIILKKLEEESTARAESIEPFPEIELEELKSPTIMEVLKRPKPDAEKSLEELAEELPGNIVLKQKKVKTNETTEEE